MKTNIEEILTELEGISRRAMARLQLQGDRATEKDRDFAHLASLVSVSLSVLLTEAPDEQPSKGKKGGKQ